MTRESTGRRSLLALAAVIALCGGVAHAAAPEARKAADWTLEERLEMRFNEESMRDRRTAAAQEAGPEWVPDDAGLNTITGARNPELFLPYELFMSLLRNAYGPHPESAMLYREHLTPLLRALGFEETFWRELEAMAEDLLSVNREIRHLTKDLISLPEGKRKEIGEQVELLQATYCQDRARILEEVEVAFGRERVHALFYGGVAPSIGISSNGVTPEQLRFIAGGCR